MSTSEVITPSLVPRVKNTKKKKKFKPVVRPKSASKLNNSSNNKSANNNNNKASASLKSPPPSAASTEQPQKAALLGANNNQKDASSKQLSSSESLLTSSSRKRKKATSIAAGSSRLSSSSPEKVAKQVTYAEDHLQHQEEQPAPVAAPAEPAVAAATKNTTTTTAVVPAVSEQHSNPDRDILARLEAEAPEGASRLNSYCSAFKMPRRARRGEAGAVEGIRQNNNNNNKKNDNRKRREAPPEPDGAPVVQIIDGEIVLQESSLMMPGQRRTVQEVEEEFGEVVHEDATPAIVGASYTSFVTRKGPQHWGIEETKRFYEALRQLGTDFCSMEAYFEDRTRKQLKRKYKSELTKNPALVEMALDPENKTDVDLSVFNVVVDAKAIEAAANDEPPVYEPTDGAEETKVAENSKEPPSKNASSSQDQWEEVFEDAAEEAQNEAAKAKLGGSAPAALVAQQRPDLWPSYEEEPVEEEHHDISMDDFFGGMDVPMGDDDDAAQHHSDPIMKPPTESEGEPAAPAISLIPKKASGKPKRPKFKAMARKKK